MIMTTSKNLTVNEYLKNFPPKVNKAVAANIRNDQQTDLTTQTYDKKIDTTPKREFHKYFIITAAGSQYSTYVLPDTIILTQVLLTCGAPNNTSGEIWGLLNESATRAAAIGHLYFYGGSGASVESHEREVIIPIPNWILNAGTTIGISSNGGAGIVAVGVFIGYYP